MIPHFPFKLQRVCLVTLQLFTRILDCWCEDAMYVLIFQYLLTCSHVMLSHRHSVMRPPPSSDLHRIVDLMPNVLKVGTCYMADAIHVISVYS